MANAKRRVVTMNLIDGRNVKDMNKQELIDIVAKTEGEIAELSALTTESTGIKAEVDALKKFLVEVVKHLDAKS